MQDVSLDFVSDQDISNNTRFQFIIKCPPKEEHSQLYMSGVL